MKCAFCKRPTPTGCTSPTEASGCSWYAKGGVAAPKPEATSALAVQVDGNHYKDMKIQPLEYCIANAIPFPEGNVIKYVSRWRKKNGSRDLRKARHMLDVLIEQAEKEGL